MGGRVRHEHIGDFVRSGHICGWTRSFYRAEMVSENESQYGEHIRLSLERGFHELCQPGPARLLKRQAVHSDGTRVIGLPRMT